MSQIHFWNGNKSAARKDYELAMLQHCLKLNSAASGHCTVVVDDADYPVAEDESNIFHTGCDVLVTVAGNQKFAQRDKIVVDMPICQDMLSHRLLIINKRAQDEFSRIDSTAQLRQMRVGVPATWADADLFRYNQFEVIENGTLTDIFQQIRQGQIDFTTLGASEIEVALEQHPKFDADLEIAHSLLVYYPLPLVFYVNPHQPKLAERLRSGLTEMQRTGQLQRVFNHFFGDLAERLDLAKRRKITLLNPQLK